MADILLEDLVKTYGDHEAIHRISCHIKPGEFMVIVGPSGCGKSTLLRMIAGLETVTRGNIRINGQCVNRIEPKDRDIAMVFQNYALYPHMTVFNNMAYGLKLRKMTKPEIQTRVRECADLLQIGHLLDRKPKELSGGQRQRVAMGRAIIRKPSVFLFDEPLSNLDAKLRQSMRVELKGLHTRLKTTMVYVTHDQVEAMTLADRIMVLNEGQIEQVGTPDVLYERPETIFTAQFIGSPEMNFIKARIVDQTLVFDIKDQGISFPAPDIELSNTENLICGIRPEHITLHGALDSGQAGIKGRIQLIERLGSDTLYYIDLSHDRRLTIKTHLNLPLQIHDEVYAGFSPDRFHLFDPASGKRLPLSEKIT
ncbi:MAG: sn-glycerol-3-phosphate ABC transporter ATP-binding protein UgpC [Desulfobacteraceae bacterium]|nr:MAG: sn-glycerol-3-phosphate ABC transporter ATP-binding protein UgpC [Desulfobacteraceae bacterium]